MEIIFVILRHVTSVLENSNELWKECYKSIRMFYNDKIIIIDNNSDYELINENNVVLENCEIINSKFFNTRLYSPFYELLNIDFYKAVIIHDGVIFQKHVDFNNFDKLKFIWHFDTKDYDNKELIEKQLNLLSNNSILFELFNEKKFTGCMGCCLAITKKILMDMEYKFKISNLKNIINNQQDAIAFERTLSLLCFALYENLSNDISFEGEIKNMVWGFRYNDFVNKNNNIDIINKSIIKIFGDRK